MIYELEKLKKEILPKLETELSIGLQKSLVQYELNQFNESLSLLESTLNTFLRQTFYTKEFPEVQEPKSISEMIRELKAKGMDLDREITSQLFRIESKKRETNTVDQVLMDSCWIGCVQILEWYLKQTKQTSEKIMQSNLEISKYILEELKEIYTEDLDENQMRENWERLKPLLDSHPHHKEIIELSLYYLSELDPKQLPGMASTLINQNQTSIRISATLVFLLAEGNFFDQGLNYLELFEKEYPNEPEILYARGFLFLKKYLQKGRRKDLELADSTLSEDYKGQDPFFSFIHSVYKSLKADDPEHKKYVIQKNMGVYLKKGSRLLPELLKTQKEIVVEPVVREEPKQEMTLEISKVKKEQKQDSSSESPLEGRDNIIENTNENITFEKEEIDNRSEYSIGILQKIKDKIIRLGKFIIYGHDKDDSLLIKFAFYTSWIWATFLLMLLLAPFQFLYNGDLIFKLVYIPFYLYQIYRVLYKAIPNKKYYTIILLITLPILIVRLYMDEPKKDWSAYKGTMNWDQANEKCKSIGMRLPTIDELKAAYKADITKSWQKDGDYYWSSTTYDAERYYKLDVDDGSTYDSVRNNSNNVRCRR